MKKRTRVALIGGIAAALIVGASTPTFAADGDDPSDLPCDSGGAFRNETGRLTYWWNNCDGSRGQDISFTGVGTGWNVCAPPGVHELVPGNYFYSATWTGDYC